MASLRQIEANRENAKKSTGPRTEEGKARSSMNALKSGLTAKTLVLTNESPARFQELAQDLTDEFNPTTNEEYACIEEMAAARWRLRRAWAIETALLDHEMDRQTDGLKGQTIDQATRLALAFKELNKDSTALRECERQQNRLSRQYDRAYARLLRLQADQKAAEQAEPSVGQASACRPDSSGPVPPQPEKSTPNEPNSHTPEVTPTRKAA